MWKRQTRPSSRMYRRNNTRRRKVIKMLTNMSALRKVAQSLSCKQKTAPLRCFLVQSDATAFAQFNYEPVSPGNSGAKEGLLMEIVLRDQLLVRPFKKRGRERGGGEGGR